MKELQTARNAGIDRLRVALTALVILHHTAIVYGGSGDWFWREQPNASSVPLILFNAVNQSYFMGLFFMIAGYFTPAAVRRKGIGRFVVDRLVRLGIPLLTFFFVLHPLTVAVARTASGEPLLAGWWRATLESDFAPGPLWFAEALLIFTFAYLAWHLFSRLSGKSRHSASENGIFPSFARLLGAASAVAAASFLVRLAWPVGTDFLWLQLGFFPGYVVLFAAGCAAARARLLEQVPQATARTWLVIAVVALAVLPPAVILRPGDGPFEGGWNLNALFYAVWEPFVAWGIILGLLHASRTRWNRASVLGGWLAGAAFGAYIVHAPILVALSVAFSAVAVAPMLKFALIGALSVAASFAVAGLLRTLPGVRAVI